MVTESGKNGWRSLTKAVMQSLKCIMFIFPVYKTMSQFLPCPEGHTDEWLAGHYINLLFVSKNVYILVTEIGKYIWQSQYMHGSWSFQNTGKTNKNNPHPNVHFLWNCTDNKNKHFSDTCFITKLYDYTEIMSYISDIMTSILSVWLSISIFMCIYKFQPWNFNFINTNFRQNITSYLTLLTKRSRSSKVAWQAGPYQPL